MGYQFKLQVPISKELNEQLKEKIKDAGFSSINEVVRFLLTNFANGKLGIAFTNQQQEMNYEELLLEGLNEYRRGETIPLDPSKNINEQLMEP